MFFCSFSLILHSDMYTENCNHLQVGLHRHAALTVCVCACGLPGKMELRSTGAWLVSTVILNLVVLAGEVGTHTNPRGRLNLDWRTLGTPDKK